MKKLMMCLVVGVSGSGLMYAPPKKRGKVVKYSDSQQKRRSNFSEEEEAALATYVKTAGETQKKTNAPKEKKTWEDLLTVEQLQKHKENQEWRKHKRDGGISFKNMNEAYKEAGCNPKTLGSRCSKYAFSKGMVLADQVKQRANNNKSTPEDLKIISATNNINENFIKNKK